MCSMTVLLSEVHAVRVIASVDPEFASQEPVPYAYLHLHHDVLLIPVREGRMTFNEYSGSLLLPLERYRRKCMTGGTACLHGCGWQECTGSKGGLCESEPRNELLTATLLFATGMGFCDKCHLQALIHRRRLSLVANCQSFYHPQSTLSEMFRPSYPRKSGIARCLICLTLYMAMARTKRKRTQENSGTSRSIHAGDSNFGV
ncbi:uncharacterized protein EAF01_007165 [Botrytis porri]|uniref:uncharacterized protein n=1 Tax=Botrytis porri TaxID=87229 RepID=UPI001900B968|nr:uncharacterized protein EAF01_007165 [Botrytis porri]KAF7901867.1 hypothetical protein EAF01_007165 [Botrytis porri]